MKCSLCKKNFLEKEIELSHDIPRYVGGTDKDGRHYFCKKCHNWYERKILSVLCEKFMNTTIPYVEGRKFLIPFMNTIKNSSISKKNEMLEEVRKIKKEVFKNV